MALACAAPISRALPSPGPIDCWDAARHRSREEVYAGLTPDVANVGSLEGPGNIFIKLCHLLERAHIPAVVSSSVATRVALFAVNVARM